MISLNPALDAGKLAEEFSRAGGILQVRDVLAPDAADEVHDMLVNHTPWGLVFNEGNHVHDLSNEQVSRLTPQQRAEIAAGVIERARTRFQFLYHIFQITPQYFNTASVVPILRFFEFLNQPATLDFLRQITGRPDVKWVDGQATLYARGHFLKSHSDLEPHANRRAAAYVFNFTPLWERDWGGYLQFFTREHDIERAFRPIFNALNIFSVPHDHSVEMVTAFAGAQRLAVTGWLRTDDPPGPFGRLSGG